MGEIRTDPKIYPHHTKLKEQQVQNIHHAYSKGQHDVYELAELYGVCVTTIYNIVRGRTWKWLNLPTIYKKDII